MGLSIYLSIWKMNSRFDVIAMFLSNFRTQWWLTQAAFVVTQLNNQYGFQILQKVWQLRHKAPKDDVNKASLSESEWNLWFYFKNSSHTIEVIVRFKRNILSKTSLISRFFFHRGLQIQKCLHAKSRLSLCFSLIISL